MFIIDLIKQLIEPDWIHLHNIFDHYEVKHNDFDTLLCKMNQEAIDCNSIKGLKNLDKKINFVISAKNYITKKELKKGQKLVQLKLDIDNKVSKELQIF